MSKLLTRLAGRCCALFFPLGILYNSRILHKYGCEFWRPSVFQCCSGTEFSIQRCAIHDQQTPHTHKNNSKEKRLSIIQPNERGGGEGCIRFLFPQHPMDTTISDTTASGKPQLEHLKVTTYMYVYVSPCAISHKPSHQWKLSPGHWCPTEPYTPAHCSQPYSAPWLQVSLGRPLGARPSWGSVP